MNGLRRLIGLGWIGICSSLLGLVLITEPIVRFARSDFGFFVSHDLRGAKFWFWLLSIQLFATGLMMTFSLVSRFILLRVGPRSETRAIVGVVRFAVVAPGVAFLSVRHSVQTQLLILIITGVGIFVTTFWDQLFTHQILVVAIIGGFLATGLPVTSGVDGYLAERKSAMAPSSEENPANLERLPVARSPRDTFVIILDEFQSGVLFNRNGELNSKYFPNLAGLIEDGSLYVDAISPSRWTGTSVPMILSGGEKAWIDASRSLIFDSLSTTHDFVVTEFSTNYCSNLDCGGQSVVDTSLGTVLGDSFAIFGSKILPTVIAKRFPRIEFRVSRFWEDLEQTPLDTAHNWLDRVRDSISSEPSDPRTIFGFLHTVVSHHPYVLSPTGEEMGPRGIPFSPNQYLFGLCTNLSKTEPHDVQAFKWTCTEDSAELLRRMYSLNLRAADNIIGELTNVLKKAGRYSDSLIVVVGDHGVTFMKGQDGRRGLPANEFSDAVINEVAYPGLIVKVPGDAGLGAVRGQRSTVQVAETVLKYNGIHRINPEHQALDAEWNAPSFEGVSISGLRDLTWPVRQRGALATVGNEKFPYALGPQAGLVGSPTSVADSHRVRVDELVVYPSHSSEFQLVYVRTTKQSCDGSYLASAKGVFVGTLSTVSSNNRELNGVLHRKNGAERLAAVDIDIYCVKT